MNLPKQSAPIKRTVSTASADQGQGVEASIIDNDIFKVHPLFPGPILAL